MLLRRAYGLRYPEPNITFALCRGNWSSPAVSIIYLTLQTLIAWCYYEPRAKQ